MKQRGLSLLEVLFALACLTVAALALVTLFGSGLKLLRQSSDLTRATEVARSVMENIKLGGYNATPRQSSYDGRIPDATDAGGFPPAPYPSIEVDGRTYTIVVRTLPKSASLKAVQVEVWWDRNSHVEVETALAP